jgi:hypothetical protein
LCECTGPLLREFAVQLHILSEDEHFSTDIIDNGPNMTSNSDNITPPEFEMYDHPQDPIEESMQLSLTRRLFHNTSPTADPADAEDEYEDSIANSHNNSDWNSSYDSVKLNQKTTFDNALQAEGDLPEDIRFGWH